MSHPPLWKHAASFAAKAHQHHLRKDGSTPYIAHPARVALICSALFGCDDETVLAAAYLHDVIEDGGADHDEIAGHFGRDIADIVAALSKDMRQPEERREPAYNAQLAAGPWQARLIKLADVYDNFTDTWDETSRGQAIEKVRRALKLARRDPQAVQACRLVAGLLDSEQT
jgi:(p)ppGpp synthase/HD superfamily hydrolase